MGGVGDAGAAFVYRYDGSSWVPHVRLVNSSVQAADELGYAVALSGDVAIVGAPFDNQPVTDAGQAAIFNLSDCNLNGFPDSLDIAQGASFDENDDLLPDECEPDCNHNGTLDVQELADDPALDYDLDGLPDECIPPFSVEAHWASVAGGIFRDHANWDPGTPVAGNTAVFDLDEVYTVGLDLDAATAVLKVTLGDVTLDLGCNDVALTSTAATGALVIGEGPGEGGALTVTGCGELALPLGGVMRIGDQAGSSGSLTVSGASTSLFAGQDACIGCAGAGDLRIEDAATAVNLFGTIGDLPGGSGAAIVTGPGSRWDVAFFLAVKAGELQVEDEGVVAVGPGGILVLPGGLISGNGSIEGDVTSIGGLEPGLSPGLLLVEGDYVQAGAVVPPFDEESGSLIVEIAGLVPELEHDVLQVTGTAVLGGGLFVTLLPPFQPGPGDVFHVLQAASIDGAFDVAFMPGLAEGRFLRLGYGAGAALGTQAATVSVEDLQTLFGFGSPISEPVSGTPRGVVVGDFDGQDGDDLAIALADEDDQTPGSVLVLLNAGTDGSGNWLGFAGSTQTAVGNELSAIAAAFLDGDAALDVAVSNRDGDNVVVLINAGAGDGSFGAPVAFPVGASPSAIAAANMNADAFTDLAVANFGDDTVQVLGNDGSAGFSTTGLFAVGIGPLAVDPSDLDNDKDADIVSANNGSNDVSVIVNLGGLGFAPAVHVDAGVAPVDLDVRDLDGDGLADVVTADGGGGTVSVLLNQGGVGAPDFAPAVSLPVGDAPRSLTGIDLEGDGDPDLAVVANGAEGDRVIKVLRNDLSGGQLNFALSDELAQGEDPLLVTTGDVDADAGDDLISIGEDLGGPVPASAAPLASASVRLNTTGEASCPWDCGDGDGHVGVIDFLAVLSQWGQVAVPCELGGVQPGVGVEEFLAVLAHWGSCP